MAEQYDAHCYIRFETWPKPAKGKKRVMVPSYRKIQQFTTYGGRAAVVLHTKAFMKTSLWLQELNQGLVRPFMM